MILFFYFRMYMDRQTGTEGDIVVDNLGNF
jgi:signal peptidase I